MQALLDSFWRAVAYCFRPQVILLSFMPVVLMSVLTLGLGYWYWDWALQIVGQMLEASSLVTTVAGWLAVVGLSGLKAVLVPLLVIFAVTPLIVLLALLLVAWFMTPAMTRLVAQRRFPGLEAKKGAGWLGSLVWSVLSTVLALVALVVSLPLWLVPPLILVLPPLIWGWLTYRVMAFDALAEYASGSERRQIFNEQRWTLLGMGVFCGFLGAAPSLIWASGALLAAAFVVLVPLAVWIYTWVFALSSLWFAHFCLASLDRLRRPVPQPPEPPSNHEHIEP
jgi:hypothetical protein